MSTSARKLTQAAGFAGGDAIERAEAAIAALAGKFDTAVRQDIANAKALVAKARAEGAEPRAILNDIFGIVHNIKGQGGSFGYQLMTYVAGSLCDYLRVEENRVAGSLGVVDGHIASLQFILDHEVRGNGGELGAKLLAKLAAMKA